MRDLAKEYGIDPTEFSGDNSIVKNDTKVPSRNLAAEYNIDPKEFSPSPGILSILHPETPFRNLAAGLATSGKNVMNFMNTPFPKSMQDTTDYAELFGASKKPADKAERELMKYIPAALIPGPSKGGSNEGMLAELSRILPSIGGQSAYGAAQNPENRTEGAVTGGMAGVTLPTAEMGMNRLKPSSLFRGNLSPEELKRNLEITQGTNTGLGSIIGSPLLKKTYENILSLIPFGGAEKAMLNTSSQIQKKGQNLLENFKGNIESNNHGKTLQDALKKAANDARQAKNESYSKVNEIADSVGLKVNRDNFSKSAQQELQSIEESPELKRSMNPKIISDLENYASNNKGNNLKLSNIFKGKISDQASEFYKNGQMHEYGIMQNLKNALGEDINRSIEESDHPHLKEAYSSAQKKYAEEFAPFEDSDITKFTREGGDPDLLLPHFLKGGANDRSNILEKLLQKLEGKNKGIPAYAYLSKAINKDGTVDSLKLGKLYSDLGEKQKDVLFSDKKLKKSIDDYSDLVKMNSNAMTLMFNPKTGYTNLDYFMKAVPAIGALMTGGLNAHSAAAMAAAYTGQATASQLLTKLMTSPAFREKLITAINKNKRINIPGKRYLTPAISAGSSASLNSENE